MTDFHCEIVRISDVVKHPNADTLSIAQIGAYPVIFRTGDYGSGDLAVYVPEGAVVPTTDPRWTFLEGKGRIKAKKLRGIFSCGLLTPIDPDWTDIEIGLDVSDRLGITKYLTKQEQNELGTNGPNKTKNANICHKALPRYTDLENLRRHPNAFAPGQTVIVMEKLDGQNCSFAYNAPTFWQRVKSWFGFAVQESVLCRSRNQMKTAGKWHELIDKLDLEQRFLQLDSPSDYSIYGETYGYTKGFLYDSDGDNAFRVFDVWDRVSECWLDYDEAYQICEVMGLDMAPVLYRGHYDRELLEQLVEGPSSLNSKHMKEGLVLRPESEQIVPGLGRLIVKLKSQAYLLRKEKE